MSMPTIFFRIVIHTVWAGEVFCSLFLFLMFCLFAALSLDAFDMGISSTHSDIHIKAKYNQKYIWSGYDE